MCSVPFALVVDSLLRRLLIPVALLSGESAMFQYIVSHTFMSDFGEMIWLSSLFFQQHTFELSLPHSLWSSFT